MNSEAKTVSIVIPCYNQGRYLRDAVDSALAQTYAHCEVIVVDDGSTDDTFSVAQSYGARVRLIRQENAGLAAARNSGILASRGTILCLLDSDDRLHPSCVEKRLQPFLEDPSVGVVAGACVFVDEHLNPLPDAMQLRGVPNTRRPGIYIRESWSPTPGLMVRRRAFELCGLFDPLLLGCEDYDFQMRVTRQLRHVYLPEPLADYRNPAGALSRNYARHFEGLIQALTKNRAYAPNRLSYAWHAAAALAIHTSDGIFGRERKQNGLRGAWRVALSLSRRRPVALGLFFAWLARAAWLRSLRLFGVGASGWGPWEAGA